MENIKKNARRLDILFRILQIACTIAAVSALVALALIGACFLFKLAPEQIGRGYNSLDIGFLEMELAQRFAPDPHNVLKIAAVELAAGFATALLGRMAMKQIRSLLAPMKEGSPFHEGAAINLKRLALLSLIIGVVLNISGLVNCLLTNHYYHLPELLEGESILRVNMKYDLDLSFLVVSGILLMLSYIFRHGQTLQQLSDETL